MRVKFYCGRFTGPGLCGSGHIGRSSPALPVSVLGTLAYNPDGPLPEGMFYVQFTEVFMANSLSISSPRDRLKPQKKSPFDAQVFLQSVGASRRVAEFQKD